MKLSVVVPIFKDAYLAKTFINELVKVDLGDTKLFEIIFVIDGGNDDDKNILSLISKNNPLVKVIVLSRNFGQHIAISAGYANTSGDYICYINVDMQDPPSEIAKLLKVIFHAINRNKKVNLMMNFIIHHIHMDFQITPEKITELIF